MTQVNSAPVVADRVAFEKLRNIAPAALAARRTRQVVRPLPDEISFKLTNRCNLRCHHCYQWGEAGHHKALDVDERDQDLDIGVVAKVLEATREHGSNVFVWGGEPLFYSHWDEFAELLTEHRRWTSICTNGVYIEKRLDSLLAMSDRLEMFIALDGFETEHEALRGALSWRRTMKGLRRLVQERDAGNYRGEVTVNCVFQDSMVGKLFDFVSFMQNEGVDAVYLSLPWHISPQTAALMDEYVADHLPEVAARVPRGTGSWHSYTFGVTPALIGDLRRDLARIDSADWRTKIRYNPKVDDASLEGFMAGGDQPASSRRTRCVSINSRLDVLPSGEGITCKLFPELAVGQLATDGVLDVWLGPKVEELRQTIDQHGLMPVCSKCPMLYSRGV
jgi:wyosine [tRNA(Phe)-imidazoG37] synthetase (radical SAM superfamily)